MAEDWPGNFFGNQVLDKMSNTIKPPKWRLEIYIPHGGSRASGQNGHLKSIKDKMSRLKTKEYCGVKNGINQYGRVGQNGLGDPQKSKGQNGTSIADIAEKYAKQSEQLNAAIKGQNAFENNNSGNRKSSAHYANLKTTAEQLAWCSRIERLKQRKKSDLMQFPDINR